MKQHSDSRRVAFGAIAVLGATLVAAPISLAGDERVLAKVGGETITTADIEPAVGAQLMKVRRDMYEVEKQGLDTILFQKLLELEASKKGSTPEEVFKAQVEAKVAAVTDGEVETFYEENKARLRGRTKEQALPQIRQYLNDERLGKARTAFYDQLKKSHAVQVMLSEPTVNVSADDDPFKGRADAPITIVEFSDFECPFCSRVIQTVDDVYAKYKDKVKIVFRDFPLNFHQNAQKAAEAAQCANEQGKFWEYHDTLFANQQKLAVDDLKAHAASLGLDAAPFAECLDSDRYAAEVQADMADGARAGVSGTPAFFINGRFLNGARPMADFEAIIEDELAKLSAN